MNEILENNDIIHIYDNKNKYLLNLHKYLYFIDYDDNNSNFININLFVAEKDVSNLFTNKLAVKNKFDRFVYDKIKNENYKIIIYDFIHLKSIYLIGNIFFNTRVYKIKTICHQNTEKILIFYWSK